MGPAFISFELLWLIHIVCDRLHVLVTGGQEIVQTSDVRVSDRVPQQSLKLHSFKPLYNEISGEVKCINFVFCINLHSSLNLGDF